MKNAAIMIAMTAMGTITPTAIFVVLWLEFLFEAGTGDPVGLETTTVDDNRPEEALSDVVELETGREVVDAVAPVCKISVAELITLPVSR